MRETCAGEASRRRSCSAFAPLALLEGGLRLAGWPTERVRSLGKLLNFDAQSFAAAVGMFRPGARSTVLWPPELAYQVHINALGLRGPEIARTPPPGRTRILALGDSMTFGFYLEESETWPARLEALLRGEGRDVEVVNAGVGGWTISSETLFLEERALALAPDARGGGVLRQRHRRPRPARATSTRARSRPPPRGAARSTEAIVTSALYELYLRGQVAWKHWREGARASWTTRSPRSTCPPRAPRSSGACTRAGSTACSARSPQRGIGLTLVYLPDVYKLANGLPADDEARLRALARERGIALRLAARRLRGAAARRALPAPARRPSRRPTAPSASRARWRRRADSPHCVGRSVGLLGQIPRRRSRRRRRAPRRRRGPRRRSPRRSRLAIARRARSLSGSLEPEQLDLRERHRELGDPRARGAAARDRARARGVSAAGVAGASTLRERRERGAQALLAPRRSRAARGSAARSRARARSRAGRRRARAARTDRPPRRGSAARRAAPRSRPRAAGSAARRPERAAQPGSTGGAARGTSWLASDTARGPSPVRSSMRPSWPAKLAAPIASAVGREAHHVERDRAARADPAAAEHEGGPRADAVPRRAPRSS